MGPGEKILSRVFLSSYFLQFAKQWKTLFSSVFSFLYFPSPLNSPQPNTVLKLTKPKINNAIEREIPQCSPYHKEKEPALFCIITNSQRERERERAAEQTSKTIEAYPMKGGDGVHSYANNSSYQVYPSLYIRIPRILGRWQVYNLLFGFEISYSYSHTHFYPSVLGGLMSPVPIFLGLNKCQRSVTSTLVSSHTLLE